MHTDLPTLTIDLTVIDTNQFKWKYHYIGEIPVTGVQGYALLSSDVDRNDQVEVYGIYQSELWDGTVIYELDDRKTWELRYTYPFQVGVIDQIDDIDRNELVEVLSLNGDTLYVFEQANQNGLPTNSKFRFRRYYYSAFGIPTELSDMTNDGKKELIFRGSEPDTQTISVSKIYVAAYDSAMNNLLVTWSKQLPPGCIDVYCAGNISSGNFDDDTLKEFVTSAFTGNVYVVECVTGDSFAVVWSDSLSVAGRVAAGDVDGNGIEEFFVGGNQAESDGYVHMRMYAYERTGNNVYLPVFAFNIFPVGYFFVDHYQTRDIDNDGQEELLLSFGGGDIIIKGNGSHQYSLFYYKRVSGSDGFSAGDVNHDGIGELLVSRFYNDGQGLFTHTEVYELDSTLTLVKSRQNTVPSGFSLFQNYPNPFNASTTITYELQKHSHVRLSIFDVTAKEIDCLVEDQQGPGRYSFVWNNKNRRGGGALASGIYLCRITVDSQVSTQKVLLLK